MHLDGYKYWLAYKKDSKSYYRCSRSKSQKCPGKIIIENSKVIISIPHDHEKEARNNAVEKFRKVLTKKSIEKPNKALVDIYLEETLNHSEASILYPFAQAESTMRKARGKALEEKRKIEEKKLKEVEEKSDTEKIYEGNLCQIEEGGRKNEEYIQNTLTKIDENFTKMDKLETKMEDSEQKYRKFEHQSKTFEGSLQNFEEKLQNIEEKLNKIQKKKRKIESLQKNIKKIKNVGDTQKICNLKTNYHQKYFYTENINKNTKVILMNQVTLNTLGKIEEIHIDCGMKIDVQDLISIKELEIGTVKEKDFDNSLKEKIGQTEVIAQSFKEKCTKLIQNNDITNKTLYVAQTDQSLYPPCQELHQISFLNQNFAYNNQIPLESYGNMSLVYQNYNPTENSQIIQTEYSACSSTENYFQNTLDSSKEISETSGLTVQIPNEEFVDQNQYYEDFLVNCSENSDNSTQNQFNIPQSSIPGEQSIKQASNKQIEQKTENGNEKQNFVTEHSEHCDFHCKTSQYNMKSQTNRYQILTLIALIKGRECPIAIGLIKSSNHETIQQLLNFLKLKISLNPSTIITSKDQNLQQSIHNSWPESTIKIMYFYYAQSVLKNFTEISKNIFEISSLKMILSMPLIPTNYVIPGWEALRKWMNEKNVDLNSLCDDVYTKWLAENAERISIFNGLTHNINNHTQMFQSELINMFEAVPTNCDNLIDKISRQATKSFIKFTKSSEGPTNKIQKLQKTVKIATKNWISSPFHLRRPIQFLQQVSHCIDDGMINFVMNFDGNFCEVKKLEPPPLVFFENRRVDVANKMSLGVERQALQASEPPPLVPIRR
ncbi:putative leucine-rich repeat-containing protein DDB_G0290503 [Chironomus tepperi]|uniref:putative leucine-rich repeat-containing protein DDB_G0290503 n=1 Tax=Chironomus tepperi TaxID=113505 RepID=UPI00391F9136